MTPKSLQCKYKFACREAHSSTTNSKNTVQ
uniref:Uncharacterized protein n=1 Tax=Anguilla anguilla TaxID=7936 RepID=A0A0E9TRL8_ANGAN